MPKATISAIRTRTAKVSAITEWTFVEVICSDGIVGLGEATVNGMATALKAYAESAATILNGLAALPNTASQLPWNPKGGLPQRAVFSAIEQALWDALGQRSGLSLCELLGGTLRSHVPLYANINRGTTDRSPDGFASAAQRAIDDGFPFVKIAPFDGVGEGPPEEWGRLFDLGCERIRSTCDAVGSAAGVMVDCHWRLDLPMVAALLKLAAEYKLFWVECPVPESQHYQASLQRLKLLAADFGVRLAGMEMGFYPAAFIPYVTDQIYDVIMPDVKFDGGLFATRCIAEAARPSGVLIAPHNPSGPVCNAASIAVSATLSNLLFLEIQYDESPLFQELVSDPQCLVNGQVRISESPGLGMKLNEHVMKEVETFA